MHARRADTSETNVRRVAVVLVLATAIVVMHVLSTSDASHHRPFGLMSAMAPMAEPVHGSGHGLVPSGHPTTPEPVSNLLSIAICAFAVLVATRATLRAAGRRPSLLVPAPEAAFRLVAGPEPPVPRSVA